MVNFDQSSFWLITWSFALFQHWTSFGIPIFGYKRRDSTVLINHSCRIRHCLGIVDVVYCNHICVGIRVFLLLTIYWYRTCIACSRWRTWISVIYHLIEATIYFYYIQHIMWHFLQITNTMVYRNGILCANKSTQFCKVQINFMELFCLRPKSIGISFCSVH